MQEILRGIKEGPQGDDSRLIEEVARLSADERWQLVALALRETGRKANHFLHIPKTGGTTFAESLVTDGKAVVVSVDAMPRTFVGHLRGLFRPVPGLPVVTRSHHPYSCLENAVEQGFIQLVFSAYREPVKLHVSNVTMIMRRLSQYLSGSHSLNEGEVLFCKDWLKRLEAPFEDTPDFAKLLLLSDTYLDYLGSVYSKFFNTPRAVGSISSGSTRILYYKDFDEMFTDVMGYEKIPPRRNVATKRYVNEQDLTAEDALRLTGRDGPLIEKLTAAFAKPVELKPFFTGEVG